MRRADPRIKERIFSALGDARTVANVGAGAGSYEPEDRHVIAIEPSQTMPRQRPPHLAPAIDACAEALPLDDDSVDAAMAIITIHHWQDPQQGLRELRRVARGAVVVLTFDMAKFDDFWLVAEYGPELGAAERTRMPSITTTVQALGGARVEAVPIGANSPAGLIEAYYGRPEAFIDPEVRAAQSVWRLLPAGVEERIVRTLATDLESGVWDQRHGGLRHQPEYESPLRLVVSPGSGAVAPRTET